MEIGERKEEEGEGRREEKVVGNEEQLSIPGYLLIAIGLIAAVCNVGILALEYFEAYTCEERRGREGRDLKRVIVDWIGAGGA